MTANVGDPSTLAGGDRRRRRHRRGVRHAQAPASGSRSTSVSPAGPAVVTRRRPAVVRLANRRRRLHRGYPRAYRLQVSADGTHWTVVRDGAGTGQLTVLKTPHNPIRYVRATLTRGRAGRLAGRGGAGPPLRPLPGRPRCGWLAVTVDHQSGGTTMASKDHFHSIVATVQPVVHGVAEDQLGNPSPCEEWTVRDVANHFLGTSEAMRRAGAGEQRDPQDPLGHVRRPHEHRLARRPVAPAHRPRRRLDARGRLGRASSDGMPKQGMGDMAFIEVMLHGWDLASATGQDLVFDDDAVAQAKAIMEQIGAMGREQGAFGELVDVGDDASDWERVLAEGGRDAGWTAG